MAEPWNAGSHTRMRMEDRRHTAGGAAGRDSEAVPVKLHFTLTSKQSHGSSSSFLSFFFLMNQHRLLIAFIVNAGGWKLAKS